jgi:aminocarboxymuconate-semialdehyde decarboxylase
VNLSGRIVRRTTAIDVPCHLVDVHAHFLPPCAHAVPVGSRTVDVTTGSGIVQIGGTKADLCVETMSDSSAVIAQMDRLRIPIRLLSAPPFALPLFVAGERALSSARTFNQQLNEICASSGGRLLGLGIVPLCGSPGTALVLAELAELPYLYGVSVPPLVESGSLDMEPLRSILCTVAALDLAVLVHPARGYWSELSPHYGGNLIGVAIP